jgi:hypothetical protein
LHELLSTTGDSRGLPLAWTAVIRLDFDECDLPRKRSGVDEPKFRRIAADSGFGGPEEIPIGM